MAATEEIEKYCRNCVSRDFVNGKGLVCNCLLYTSDAADD